MTGQTGDFDNAKSPAAMLQKNSPAATCLSIYTVGMANHGGAKRKLNLA